jgi:copper(I)-binding protein
MKSIIRTTVLILTMMLAGSMASMGHEIKAGDLLLTDLWCRATPPGAKVGAAYLTIENKGTAADRLVGLSSPASGQAEVHEMSMANGVMTMRPVTGGVALPPGKKVTLSPGGYHIMLTGLKAPLKEGEMLHVTLKFEKAGDVDATFHIRSVGAQGPNDAAAKPGHDGMKAGGHSGMKM